MQNEDSSWDVDLVQKWYDGFISTLEKQYKKKFILCKEIGTELEKEHFHGAIDFEDTKQKETIQRYLKRNVAYEKGFATFGEVKDWDTWKLYMLKDGNIAYNTYMEDPQQFIGKWYENQKEIKSKKRRLSDQMVDDYVPPVNCLNEPETDPETVEQYILKYIMSKYKSSRMGFDVILVRRWFNLLYFTHHEEMFMERKFVMLFSKL